MDFWSNIFIVRLIKEILRALMGVVEQARAYWEAYIFVGHAGTFLAWAFLAFIAILVLRWGFARAGALAYEAEGGPGHRAYRVIANSLILVSFLLLIAAAFNLQPGNLVQLAVFIPFITIVGAHIAWFAADRLARMSGWRAGGRFLERVAANRTAYYFILPTLVMLGVFNYIPAGMIVFLSFSEYEVGGTPEWVGLENFVRLFTEDPVFWKSMFNMLLFVGFQTAVTLTVPLIVAELIVHLKTERARYYCRAVFLLPIVVPMVIIFLIWEYFYSDTGLVPLLGHALGFGDALEGLLSRPQTALFAVMLVGFPFVHGVNLLIYYAGLSNISESVWEAAKLDGATPFARFLYIDIPLLARQFKLLLILSIITGVQAFENVLVMTDQGGPGWQTMLPGLYMYRSAMAFREFGYACAVGLFLFLIVLSLSLMVNRYFSDKEKHD